MEYTGSRFHVYLRLLGAISVECSDESSRYERVTSQIARNPAKPLRRRLRNNSLFSCYVVLATQSTVFTCVFDGMATDSRSASRSREKMDS
jgi:hypothetical protein